MFKERYRVRQLEYCNKQMFGNLIVTCPTYATHMPKKLIQPVPITVKPLIRPEEIITKHLMEAEKRRTSILVDQLLLDIHNSFHHSTDYNSTTSGRSSQKYNSVQSHDLYKRDLQELSALTVLLGGQIERVGIKLVRRLKRRDALRRQQEAQCYVITCQLKKLLPNTEDMCFTVNPQPSESGFSQWVAAMKMVAQLPGGIPPEFRRRLWLTMAEKHLTSKGVDWMKVERTCFSEWSHPEDGELGVQIVKDLHRTGCSLFCGEGGQENQALLKKVLLAYARWNKAVGYCQGFNMLAALILQVTEKSETDALKLMIYLIEGVLPDSYFADSLRGLSVDMAVFRELLRTRLPRLSKHLDLLQNMAKEGTTSYEPPLTNVFTMQWFLTLFCNCLPQPSVLRVWDLILLEGNEVLLRTALAIWQALADRIVRVKTADEFYCLMGVLTNELLENNLMDANSLIKSVVSIGPLTELKSLREHYLYNINPWGAMPSPTEFSDKQLKLYPKERLALDISALKKQYLKLKQRQRQAHIIFTAAIGRHPPPRTPVAMNHLLIGKSALVPARRLGPPKGSIPPIRIPTSGTLHWKDTSKNSPSSSSSDTELCDENDPRSEPSDHSNQVSPIHELPQDNPLQPDTSINTITIEPVVSIKTGMDNTEECDFTEVSEIFVPSHSHHDVAQIVDLDSEDDSVDFELFLEDRVKSFKQVESPNTEENRVNVSRRNSERALQIIQENSLILHRILQCQSRLSLSPPLTETGVDTDDDTFSKRSLDSYRHAGDGMFSSSCSGSETATGHVIDGNELASSGFKIELEQNSSDFSLPEIPIDNVEGDGSYRSKYNEILERSRDLNAKYYSQILHSNDETESNTFMIPESKTFTNQEELIDFSSEIPTNVQNKDQQCETSKENSLIDSGSTSYNFNSSIMNTNAPSLLKDSESIIGHNKSEEYDDCTVSQTHSTIINKTYDPLLYAQNDVKEFPLTSIGFCPNFVKSQQSNHDSIGEIRQNQTMSISVNKPEESEIESFQPIAQNQVTSPQHHIVWSDEMHQEKEFNYTLVDVSVTPSPSRHGDTSEDTFSFYSKDSGTDSTSISEKDGPSPFISSGYKSKSVASSNHFSFDNIPHKLSNKKSLSANNSIENTEVSTDCQRSLSASNFIERAACTSARTVIEEIPESSKNSFIRLKKTIKSPEIPCESSFRSFSQISSSNLIDTESPIRYPKVEEKRANYISDASPVVETDGLHYVDGEAICPKETSFVKSSEIFSSDDYISSYPQCFVNCRQTISPSREFCVDTDISPTKNNRILSPVSRKDKFHENMYSVPKELKSPISEHFSSSEKNVVVSERSPVGIDHKFGEISIRSPREDSSSNKRSNIPNFPSPVRSPGLSGRSPIRREEGDHKQFLESYRDTRSPISDSIVRNLSSPERMCLSPVRSPSAGDNRCYENVSPKSPSKIFNPFPVPLSSRQNKEVAVKLGLYKK